MASSFPFDQNETSATTGAPEHERWLRDDAWKGSNGPIKNRDLWERLFALVWGGPRIVTFTWIKGHKRDYPNNNRVDQLAQAAALSAG